MRPTLAIVLLALVCAGCTTMRQPGAPPARAVWIDLVRGEAVSTKAVLDDLARAGVVFIGETHGVAYHHRVQLEVLQALFARGVPLLLCLEQLEAGDQPAIDRYNRREIDFATLAREIDWPRKWTNYLDYRALCEFARQHGIPIVGLNAPAQIIRDVFRNGGIEKLTQEQRAQLPADLAISSPEYERLIQTQLGAHSSARPENLRAMYEAQVARDEAMAATIVAARAATEPRRTALVIAGAGHVRYGFGTVDGVRRRDPGVVDRAILIDADGMSAANVTHAARNDPSPAHEDLRTFGHPPADYLNLAPVSTAQANALPPGHPPLAR